MCFIIPSAISSELKIHLNWMSMHWRRQKCWWLNTHGHGRRQKSLLGGALRSVNFRHFNVEYLFYGDQPGKKYVTRRPPWKHQMPNALTKRMQRLLFYEKWLYLVYLLGYLVLRFYLTEIWFPVDLFPSLIISKQGDANPPPCALLAATMSMKLHTCQCP